MAPRSLPKSPLNAETLKEELNEHYRTKGTKTWTISGLSRLDIFFEVFEELRPVIPDGPLSAREFASYYELIQRLVKAYIQNLMRTQSRRTRILRTANAVTPPNNPEPSLVALLSNRQMVDKLIETFASDRIARDLLRAVSSGKCDYKDNIKLVDELGCRFCDITNAKKRIERRAPKILPYYKH